MWEMIPGHEPSVSVCSRFNSVVPFFDIYKIKNVSSQLLRAAQFSVLSRRYGEHVWLLELHQGCRASEGKYCPGFLLKESKIALNVFSVF